MTNEEFGTVLGKMIVGWRKEAVQYNKFREDSLADCNREGRLPSYDLLSSWAHAFTAERSLQRCARELEELLNK